MNNQYENELLTSNLNAAIEISRLKEENKKLQATIAELEARLSDRQ